MLVAEDETKNAGDKIYVETWFLHGSTNKHAKKKTKKLEYIQNTDEKKRVHTKTTFIFIDINARSEEKNTENSTFFVVVPKMLAIPLSNHRINLWWCDWNISFCWCADLHINNVPAIPFQKDGGYLHFRSIQNSWNNKQTFISLSPFREKRCIHFPKCWENKSKLTRENCIN